MLYIMRHGKTDWNAKYKLQGRTDVPINDEGREMARRAHDEYESVHFDVCYCSPLVRARETAEILLAGRDVPIITDYRLVEMCYGIYEGQENSFSMPDCPINTLFRHPELYTVPAEGAESLDDLYKRTGAFLEDTLYPALKKCLDVLIVGHGAMNCSIICQVNGIPRKDFWSAGIENCKLKELRPFEEQRG